MANTRGPKRLPGRLPERPKLHRVDGATWNPVTGCDRVSEGCDHCYALTLAARLKAKTLGEGPDRGVGGKPWGSF